MNRRLASLAATAALVLSVSGPVAGPVATAAGRSVSLSRAPHGSPGIGDPYFPLDGNGGIDVLRYDIQDRYRFTERVLSGRTAVTLRTTEALASFDLDFLLPVRWVRVDGRTVRFHQRGHELVVEHASRAGQRLRVVVRYSGRPGRFAYLGEHNWLANGREVVAMNEPHMAPWWFPANDHPLDRALVRMSITVPKAQQVIGNGRRVGRVVHGPLATTTWQADEPMVPYLAFFAAGRFVVDQGRTDGHPWYAAVSALLPAAERRVAMRLMRRSPELVSWLEERLGPYPFSTTGGLTTSMEPGFALENQTRPTYPYLGDGPGAVTTVVHELAHQWFGDSVALAAWRDIWLNEGAATFMEAYYDETHGGQSAQQWMRTAYDDTDPSDDFWHHEVADPCPTHQDCVNSIFRQFVYQRGGMALQALRNRIGEDDFWTLLQRWVTDRAGGNGSTADFEALAAEVSGQDLSGFFDAWLHSPTKPADVVANGLGGS